jgi:hypothetical protein
MAPSLLGCAVTVRWRINDYSDGDARRKEFDADPSPSLFLSEAGESTGQGWVDKRQGAGKESSANNAQRWWCIREPVFKRQYLEIAAEGAVSGRDWRYLEFRIMSDI